MLASAVQLEDIQFPVLATPKLDGIRCLKVNGKALSRKFKPIPNHFIRTWIEENCPDGFDGEIICPGKTFNETQSLVMTQEGEPEFYFWVFDYVLDINKPYVERIKDLQEWKGNTTQLVMLYPIAIEDLEHLLIYEAQVLHDNYEGVMIRSWDSPYKCGRSTVKQGYLLKIKRFTDTEGEVVAFEELYRNNNALQQDELGHAKRSTHKANMIPANTLGALVVRDLNTGEIFSIGTGFDNATRDRIWQDRDSYLGKIVTYKFQPSGMKEKPRFPVFKGFRHADDM